MTFRRATALVVFVLISFASRAVFADTAVNPSTEYRDRVKVAETVQPLGATPFGENVNLYRGGLSFLQTDISVPGTGPTITLARSYELGGGTARAYSSGEMADWSLSIPRIKTILPGNRFAKFGQWQVEGANGDARCSQFAKISVAPYSPLGQQWWSGYQLETADGASRALLKRTAENTIGPTSGVYNIVTADHWMVTCLATTANGMPGEAFLAVSPDGTKYWFNQLVYGPAVETLTLTMGGSLAARADGRANSGEKVPSIDSKDAGVGPDVYAGGTTAYLPRKLGYLYVTRIEDRFGNSLTYQYTNNRPTSITASDGRQILIAWRSDAPVVSSITVAPTSGTTQTWNYEYVLAAGANRLVRTVLPDQSAWTYAMNYADRLDFSKRDGEFYAACGVRATSNPGPAIATTFSMTHPSGLTGSFSIGEIFLARSYVFSSCDSQQMESVPSVYLADALVAKTLSGPGISEQTWSYRYLDAMASTISECSAVPCDTTSSVEVTAPDGFITRFTHSTRSDFSEGKLLSVISGLTAPAQPNPLGLSKLTKAYAPPSQGPWPTRIGDALSSGNNGPIEVLTPANSEIINQQAVTFTRTTNGFDSYGNPTSVTRASTGLVGPATGYSRTETTAYFQDPVKWVVGQVQSVTDVATARVMSRTQFNAQDLPASTFSFEVLQQTLAYNADGTLLSVTDGRGKTTTLGGWKAGIPQTITYPTFKSDGITHVSVGAVVNGIGNITSTTDELGATTSYGYDLLGRLTSITYPTGDVVAWNGTTRSFAPVAVAEYGLPAGHWKQTVQSGNGKATTFYDAQWRPVLTLTEDTGNAATRTFVVTRFDSSGRTIFTSYPVASLTSINDTLTGVTTVYDGLGRVHQTKQDSELGVLTSSTDYLDGFQVKTTNPRGKITTTSYQVFDAPSTDAPVGITLPQGVYTTITRQPTLGKPLSVSRSGVYGGNVVGATRYYVYGTDERLCKTINPESGAALVNYDAAGNIDWSADGTALTTLTCDRGSVSAADKTTRSYDAMNRMMSATTVAGTANVSTTYDDAGQVTAVTAANPGGAASTAYTYGSKRGLLTGETSSSVGGATFSLAYGYNANAHLSQLTYPDGQVVQYAPDALGRATQVTSVGQNYATGISYHPGGAIAGFTYGNGIVHAMTQNLRRLPARSLDSLGATKYLDDSYVFDANGNVDYVTDAAGTGPQNRTKDLGYDDLDRLIVADAPNQWGAATYAYDPMDNIRSADQGARQYRYNYSATNNRLIDIKTPAGATVFGFTYDARGNTTAKGAQGYTFDSANRLNQVNGVQSYIYDGQGRRVRTTDANSTKTSWIYSQAGQVLYTDEGRTGKTLNYIYLGNTQVAVRSLVKATSVVTVLYQHTDSLGSPVVETTPSLVTTRHSYAPYGEGYGEPGGGSVDGTGYTGHVMDKGTGLTYMQQRYYDPASGRFLSIDPISTNPNSGASFNRYSYANSNPFRFMDPDGRWSCDKGQDCSDFREGLSMVADSAKSALLSNEEKKVLQDSVDFYGKEDGKGPVIAFANLAGANGSATAAKVTFDRSSMSREGATERSAQRTTALVFGKVIAHEGDHGQREKSGEKSAIPRLQLEIKGFRAQAYFQKANNWMDPEGSNGFTRWGGVDAAAIEGQAIYSTVTACGSLTGCD